MSNSSRDLYSELAVIKSEILYLRKDVNRMLEVLLEHPEHSLSPRMKIVEVQATEFKKALDKMEAHSWQVKMALLGSVFTFLTSVAILIVQLGLKKL